MKVKENLKSLMAAVVILMVGVSGPLEAQSVTYYGDNGDIVDLDPLQIARLDCPQAIIGEGGDIICPTVGSGELTLGGMTNTQVASADQEVNLILNAIESLKVCSPVPSEPTDPTVPSEPSEPSEPTEPYEPSEIGATFTEPEVDASCVVDVSVTDQQVAEIMADAYLMISDIYREKAQ